MDDKTYRKYKVSLTRTVAKWRDIMGFNSYRFDFNWDRSYCTDNDQVAAEVKCSWMYKTVLVTFYLPRLQDMSDDEIESVIVHELCHVLVHPVSSDLRDDQPDFNEKVEYATTCIALALRWAYEAGERVGTAAERKRRSKSAGEDTLHRADKL
jgi:hypothetical protein